MLAHRGHKKKEKNIHRMNPPTSHHFLLPTNLSTETRPSSCFLYNKKALLLYISEYKKLPSWSTYSMVCWVAQ